MPVSLVVELTDVQLAIVADHVAELLAAETPTPTAEPWLDVRDAALHLAVSTSRIYELCHKRSTTGFPVHKDGSRSYFKASELDGWRASRPIRGER